MTCVLLTCVVSETLLSEMTHEALKSVFWNKTYRFLIFFFFLQLLQIKDTMPSLHFLKEKPGHDSDFGQESKIS